MVRKTPIIRWYTKKLVSTGKPGVIVRVGRWGAHRGAKLRSISWEKLDWKVK